MSDEDKQFEASAHKLKQARDQGQVVKSKDFSTALSLLIMCLVIIKMGPFVWQLLAGLFIKMYEQIPNAHIDKIGATYLITTTIIPTVAIIGPILFIAFLVAIFGELIQVGPLFTTKPLEPKFDKFNPVNYFKNLASVKTVFELLKNIFKVVVLGYIGYVVYKAHIPTILNLAGVDNTFAIMDEFGKLVVDFITKAGIIFFVIAAADYMMQRWKFMKDQKMSYKEMKDEYKNTEGDPHVKAALRQRRMQMLQQDMLDSVVTADFVITNPTHVAVAIKYEAEEMRAPMLVAKGTELFAKRMIEVAKANNVPVIENPPVARAVYRMVEVKKEVPPELYKAVAEILLFVYNLRKKTEVDLG